MTNDYRQKWELYGGNTPAHWSFSSIEELLENSKAIAVGVMYPGGNTENGVPLIKVSDIKNGRVVAKPEFLISDEKDHEYRRTRIAGQELLITLVGNPGDCVLVTSDMVGWNVARAIAAVRFKDPSLRRWIRYACLSRPAQNFFDSRLNTTVQKTLNLKDIKELALPIPPVKERESITNFIDALDDKIELNRQMNATLEAIAQTLFKSWFVDFDPVIDNALAAGNPIPEPFQKRAAARKALGNKRKPLPEAIRNQFCDRFVFNDDLGWIPESWEICNLGEIAYFKNGKKSPNRSIGDIPVYGSNGQIGVCEDHNRENVVIVGRVGTYCGSLFFCDSKCWVTDNAMSAEMHDSVHNLFLYELLKRSNLNDRRSGSGQPLLNQSILSSIKTIKPCLDLISEFSTISTSFYQKIFLLSESNTNLEKLRDTLLPKLLSGQLRIPEAEKQIAEVL